MDDEIKENLQEFSKHLHDVARMIGSKRPDLEKLTSCRDCLQNGAKTLDVYIKLEKEYLTTL